MASYAQWAVVTGAGSGIGAALTHRLLAAGLNVVAVGRRKSALNRTADAVAAAGGGNLVTLSCDIGTTEGRLAVFRTVPTEGKLRFVVHNAAVGDPNALGQTIDVDAFR